MDKRAEAVAALRRRIGHDFADPELLERALTHPSVSGAKARNNQVLEFLGDRVLSLLVAEALVALGPQWREGDLSRRQVALVSGASCAKVARDLDVGPALRMEGSHSKQGGRTNDRILGDAMEAIVAAVYLDGGLEAARGLFNSAWKGLLDLAGGELRIDAKSRLNEWAMARGYGPPTYITVGRVGSQHAPTFTVEVVAGDLPPASAIGASVRAAEQAAAEALLQREDSI
jgi:ribonuclease-3